MCLRAGDALAVVQIVGVAAGEGVGGVGAGEPGGIHI